MYPIGFKLGRSVSLLQEDDVGHDRCSCVCLESIVRQTDSTEQVCSLSDIPTDFGGLLIHRVAGGYKRNHAAGSNLVESLSKEIIVDGKAELIISTVIHLVLTERHIADCKVIEVFAVGGLKSCNGNICLWVKLFCDSPRDAVQLHAVELTVLHRFGQKPKEVADTHRRL